MAQLVEHNLAKVGVAGSSPVVRSRLHKPRESGAFFFSESSSIQSVVCIAGQNANPWTAAFPEHAELDAYRFHREGACADRHVRQGSLSFA